MWTEIDDRNEPAELADWFHSCEQYRPLLWLILAMGTLAACMMIGNRQGRTDAAKLEAETRTLEAGWGIR